MTKIIPKFDEQYFGSFSRESLKAIKFMIEKWPKKKIFTNEEIGQAIKTKGRALGGILGAFSKRESFSMVMKMGVVSANWTGEKLNCRPKQIWALNPQLKKDDIEKIKEILDNFLLDL